MEQRMYKTKTELDFVWQSMGSVDNTIDDINEENNMKKA